MTTNLTAVTKLPDPILVVPKIEQTDGGPVFNFGKVLSPSLAMAIVEGLRKVALDHPTAHALGTYALAASQSLRLFLEASKQCDCALCQAQDLLRAVQRGEVSLEQVIGPLPDPEKPEPVKEAENGKKVVHDPTGHLYM